MSGKSLDKNKIEYILFNGRSYDEKSCVYRYINELWMYVPREEILDPLEGQKCFSSFYNMVKGSICLTLYCCCLPKNSKQTGPVQIPPFFHLSISVWEEKKINDFWLFWTPENIKKELE